MTSHGTLVVEVGCVGVYINWIRDSYCFDGFSSWYCLLVLIVLTMETMHEVLLWRMTRHSLSSTLHTLRPGQNACIFYIFKCEFNSSHPSAAYRSMRQWTGSALVQIMACRLFGAILITIQNVSFTKMHLKTLSAKWWPFCSGGDELKEKACILMKMNFTQICSCGINFQ